MAKEVQTITTKATQEYGLIDMLTQPDAGLDLTKDLPVLQRAKRSGVLTTQPGNNNNNVVYSAPHNGNDQIYAAPALANPSYSPSKGIGEILDDHVVKPWQFLFHEFSTNFPTDALYDMFMEHQYVDLSQMWDLPILGGRGTNGIASMFNMPSKQISAIADFLNQVGQNMPQYYYLAQENTSELNAQLGNYVSSMHPILEWMRPTRAATAY